MTFEELSEIGKEYSDRARTSNISELVNCAIEKTIDDKLSKLLMELLEHKNDFLELIHAYEDNNKSYNYSNYKLRFDRCYDTELLWRTASILETGKDCETPNQHNGNFIVGAVTKLFENYEKRFGKNSWILKEHHKDYTYLPIHDICIELNGSENCGIQMYFPEIPDVDCDSIAFINIGRFNIKYSHLLGFPINSRNIDVTDKIYFAKNISQIVSEKSYRLKEHTLNGFPNLKSEFRLAYDALSKEIEEHKKYEKEHLEQVTGIQYTELSNLGKSE